MKLVQIKRLELQKTPPLIKGQDLRITNLLETKDQVTHATKLALIGILGQPRQQPCQQSISAEGQIAWNAATIPIIRTTSANLETVQKHPKLILILLKPLQRRETNVPIKIRRTNEMVQRPYRHAPIMIIQNHSQRMVQQHHQQHSLTQERVTSVRPKGTLLRTAHKSRPIKITQRLNLKPTRALWHCGKQTLPQKTKTYALHAY